MLHLPTYLRAKAAEDQQENEQEEIFHLYCSLPPRAEQSTAARAEMARADTGRTGRHRKRKLLLSKLYTFAACARRPSAVDDEGSRIGGPGFSRVVHTNDPAAAAAAASAGYYRSNRISTTKYSALTFLPKSLFEQFRRVANIYFLAAALLSYSPIAPFRGSTAVAPLVLVLVATMVKEAIEDWRRKQQVYMLEHHSLVSSSSSSSPILGSESASYSKHSSHDSQFISLPIETQSIRL